MPKIRVGQLAKELNLKVAELVDRLRGLGVEVKSNLSTIDEATVERVRGSAPAAAATKAVKPIPAAPSKTPARPAPRAAARAVTAALPTPPVQAKPAARPATAASPGIARAPQPVVSQAKGTVKPAPAGG